MHMAVAVGCTPVAFIMDNCKACLLPTEILCSYVLMYVFILQVNSSAMLELAGMDSKTNTRAMLPTNVFVDDERLIFFITDSPHNVKNIRNCMYNKVD